ncbi:MAG: cupredoxin domain-containing protein, partial [Candidatus Thermoplasmatota archaeon]|nr:cupredoxin domain-containing protein [Candidatus Thermoplasmatota archaeon]
EVAIQVEGNTTNDTARQAHVEITDQALVNSTYTPANISVEPGQQVVWTNNGTYGHTVTFENETLESSDLIAPGGNYTLTLPEDLAPGEYAYHDTATGVAEPGQGILYIPAA